MNLVTTTVAVTIIIIIVILITTTATTTTHATPLLQLTSNTTLRSGIDRISHGAVDPTSSTAYVGTWTAPGSLVKINMATLETQGTVYLNEFEDYVSCVIFAAQQDRFVYVGLYGDTSTDDTADSADKTGDNDAAASKKPTSGIVVRIDPVSMARVSALVLSAEKVASSIEIGPGVLLFGCDTTPVKIIKVTVNAATGAMAEVSSLALQNKENYASTMLISPFVPSATTSTAVVLLGLGTGGATDGPAKVVRLTVGTGNASTTADVQRTGVASFAAGEDYIANGFVADGFIYWLCYTSPGIIVKTQDTGAVWITRISSLKLEGHGENYPATAVFDAASGVAFIGLRTWPGIVVRVNISSSFTRISADWVDDGDRYFSVALQDPLNSNNMLLATDAAAAAAFVFALNSTAVGVGGNSTAYVRQSHFKGGDALVATAVVMPPLGKTFEEVKSAVSDDSMLLLVCDTRPGLVVQIHANTLQHTGAIALPLGEDYLRAVVIDAFGFAFITTCTRAPSAIVRINTQTMTRVSSMLGKATEECFHSAVIAPNLMETTTASVVTAQYAYFTSLYGDATKADGATIVKTKITKDGMTRLTDFPAPQQIFTPAILDPHSLDFVIYGTYSTTGIVVRFFFGRTSTSSGSSGAVEQPETEKLTLRTGEGLLRDGVIWRDFAYIVSSTPPPGILKIQITSTPMQRVGRLVMNGVSFYSAVLVTNGLVTLQSKSIAEGPGSALFGASGQRLYRIELETLRVEETLRVAVPGVLEGLAAGAPGTSTYYGTTYTAPTRVFTIKAPIASVSSSAPFPVFEVIAGTVGGLIFVAIVAMTCYTYGRKTQRRDIENGDEPMLQMPRQTVTVVHTGMLLPDRADLNDNIYNNGVVMS